MRFHPNAGWIHFFGDRRLLAARLEDARRANVRFTAEMSRPCQWCRGPVAP